MLNCLKTYFIFFIVFKNIFPNFSYNLHNPYNLIKSKLYQTPNNFIDNIEEFYKTNSQQIEYIEFRINSPSYVYFCDKIYETTVCVKENNTRISKRLKSDDLENLKIQFNEFINNHKE